MLAWQSDTVGDMRWKGGTKSTDGDLSAAEVSSHKRRVSSLMNFSSNFLRSLSE